MRALAIVVIPLLVAALVIGGCGGGGGTKPTLTPSPTPSDFTTFSKYGFSFQYHKSLSITEQGIFENEATERSGMVFVGIEEDLFGVAWQEMEPSMLEVVGLEMIIDGSYMGLGLAGEDVQIERGEQAETTHAGHRVLYEDFAATTEGDGVNGILGAFYCDKSQRLFTMTMLSPAIRAKEDLLEDFMTYLDSFVCH